MSRIESFYRMFDNDTAHGDVITSVVIPLIQRDFAQGRNDTKAVSIRKNFLAALHTAIAGDDARPIGLDFVYGERTTDGKLHPLDGQQRLTTLFLLHWYLAARSGNLALESGWKNFSYETRPSAMRFCERLVKTTPPADVTDVSKWIEDQPWYLFVWRYDPTINSMLVMIDAIHDQFGDVDPQVAWSRLTDVNNPAVSFHLLPLPDMGSAEDLYIKMNSRGKPLTDFENFKAQFEKIIEWAPRERVDEFAKKVDTTWSDVLWAFRGNDDLVDDEFLRYFEFIIEVCEWTDDTLESGTGTRSLIQRANRVFGPINSKREEHLTFLFTAFDVWVGRDIAATFNDLFRKSSSPENDKLPLFFRDPNVNLFESCCRAYGETTGSSNRNFTFGQTLLLLAVVLHLDKDTEDFPNRLRSLRNLIEGSSSGMRATLMPRLVSDTRELIVAGVLPDPGNTFAVAQIGDENDKREFLAQHPEAAGILRKLEDNPLLRGSTSAFALEAAPLQARVNTFNTLTGTPALWWDVTGALLACGNYQRPRGRGGKLDDSSSFQFGTPEGKFSDAWREAFVGRSRTDASATSKVLCDFLDALASSENPLDETLRRIQEAWLNKQEEEKNFDWRYYLVKYPSARKGASGIYYAEGRRMGFSLTNLPGGKSNRNANYHDPYLQSILEVAGKPDGVDPLWFSGNETKARWLRLTKSGTGLRCVPKGFEVARPASDEFHSKFNEVMSEFPMVEIDETVSVVEIAKATNDEAGPDSEDRIVIGSRILKRLIEAGL